MTLPSAPRDLLALNPDIDVADCRDRFARHGRVQIRNVLTEQSAKAIADILRTATPWGLALRDEAAGNRFLPNREVRQLSPEQRAALGRAAHQAASGGRYGFLYRQFPLVDAYVGKWAPGGPHDLLIEHINDTPFQQFAKAVTGLDDIVKADAQASLFAPGDFLTAHNDIIAGEGRRAAYVLNFADPGWRPDWGGYLTFLDEDGDIVEGWKPRFNTLNLMRVPQMHSVSYVTPFAPVGRFAISGWFRAF